MSASTSPVLPLSLLNPDRFNALFYEPVPLEIQLKSALHLHIIRVQNADFDLAGLYRELINNSITYVLSRQNASAWLSDVSRTMEIANKVQSQFRKPDPLAGEGGEVLLYSLLEGHLQAPKILSKMELKTDAGHYVYGSDGVHLLQTGDSSFELIFGESKMYGDVAGKPGSSARRGIKAAFKSVGDVSVQGFDFDTWLVESELLKEALTPAQVDVLARILLPTPRGEEPIAKVNAFGIFIGYELDVTDMKFEELSLPDIEAELCRRARAAIEAEIETIRTEIKDRDLGGYPIHMYAVPFTKRMVNGKEKGIEQVREELAAKLGHNEMPKK